MGTGYSTPLGCGVPLASPSTNMPPRWGAVATHFTFYKYATPLGWRGWIFSHLRSGYLLTAAAGAASLTLGSGDDCSRSGRIVHHKVLDKKLHHPIGIEPGVTLVRSHLHLKALSCFLQSLDKLH